MRRVEVGGFALWIALWCFGAFVLVDTFRPLREYLVPLMFVTFAALIGGGLYLHNAKCPNCGDRFAVKSDGSYSNTFSSKCVNCGVHLA